MMDLVVRYPQVVLLFPVLLIVLLVLYRFARESSCVYPRTAYLLAQKYQKVKLRERLPRFLRLCAVLFVLVALAQPLGRDREVDYETKAVDIIIALDISGSMRAEDFQPDNRLMVAKDEAKRFIESRPSDRIGLVVFASQSYTQCPLTIDHDILFDIIDQVTMGVVKDGTAIGLAIANATNRLMESEAKSKVIILITDGENNAGQIDPFTAAEIAKKFKVKIYSIGVGRGGLVPYPMLDPLLGKVYRNIQIDVDETTLKEVSRITGGSYFRARDRQGLREIYSTIDSLEKTEIAVSEYVNYQQLFQYPLAIALFCVVLELLLRVTVYYKLP